MKLDQSYWNERYLSAQTGWDLGKVSRPLQFIIDSISDKNASILIPGAGNAHEAHYLLSQGFQNVTVLDIAPAPVNELKQLFQGKPITVLQGNFFNHHGTYDIILEQTFFCALESRFRESYPKKTVQLLTDKGVLTGVLFNFTQQRTEPPYGGTAEEYRSLFDPYFNLNSIEPCTFSEEDRKGKELFIHFTKK
jgi:thiopurine S-methyltransferase